VWTLTITNQSPSPAVNAAWSSFSLTQTYGAACTPAVLTSLPVSAGTIAGNSSGQASITIDFSSCAANVRFKAQIGITANGGAATGALTLSNQMQ
jgi:hypothetical protein